MLSTRIPSVKDTYFQHKVLTKVHGKPTYEGLQTLATEIKANAGSVPSAASGGANGHLSMILSAARYATLAGTVPCSACKSRCFWATSPRGYRPTN